MNERKNPLILLLNIEMNSKKDKKSFLTPFSEFQKSCITIVLTYY